MSLKSSVVEVLDARQLFAGASVTGFVFNDLDVDGKKDTGEVNLPGVTVYLDKNNNNKLDTGEKSIKTDSAGKYAMTGVAAGDYIVRQIVPSGMVQTVPTRGFGYHIALAAGQVVTNKFFGDVSVATAIWSGFARDPQHTGLSQYAADNLTKLHWSTAVDLQPDFSGDELFIHYGSPVITRNNTVIVPVKTTLTGGFKLEARRGSDGTVLWSKTTDYILPPHNWTPSYQPAVSSTGRIYYAGAGGTVYWRDSLDAGTGNSGQICFYGLTAYKNNKAAMDAKVFIDTPITADANGNIYFGIQVTGSNPLNVSGGIVRIAADGTATFVKAADASGDVSINKVAQNCAPALSNDGKILYVGLNTTPIFGAAFIRPRSYLVALDAKTLKTIKAVRLVDPLTGGDADVNDLSTASPTVGPDGDVYYGVLDQGLANHDRGFLLHFSSDLSTQKTIGSFGWDDTASIVPASMVPSYHGTSSYLLMTKYNDYASLGGTGVNRLAILDPNATQIDSYTGLTVMKEVLTVAGVTPDQEFPDLPGAVREWCINSAAVDPKTFSILANSEDGSLYRWDLRTNTLTQTIALTGGIGEAYTSTVIGPDGTVYATNKGILWAVGK